MMQWMLMPYRKLYRLIEGRSSRSEYWYFTLLNVIIAVVFVGLFFGMVGSIGTLEDPNAISGALLGATFGIMFLLIIPLYIWALVTGVAGFAVTIRRFHDLNLSGWLYLLAMVLFFVPIVNFLAWIGLLVLMCLKGTDGPNKYGDDPLEPETASVFE